MKLLLTGAFSYTSEQIKELEEIVGEVIYIKDERNKIGCIEVDIVVCNSLFIQSHKFKQLKFIQLTGAGFDRIHGLYKIINIQ